MGRLTRAFGLCKGERVEFVVTAHAALSHFPIAFLLASFVATLLGRFTRLKLDSFLPLALGTGLGLLSVVTGLIVHEPYEDLPIIDEIKIHQFTALAGVGVMVVLSLLRFRARRSGHDLERSTWYPILAGAGIVWIIAVGATGGDLVYEHGLGVQGTDPLRAAE